MGEHIVTSFDEDLLEIRARISEMGGLAEAELSLALECIEKRDATLADQVLAKDKRLDALEFEVERLVTQVIARRQPLAQDLRLVISAMKDKYTKNYYAPVEMTGLYWHFVDIVWIFLFPLLYLLGRH